MGSTCSKNNYSRSSSRKMLCDNTMPIANLDETIGQGNDWNLVVDILENYGVQSNASRSTNVTSHTKPSAKEQLLDFSVALICSYSTGSTGTVVDSFQTKTLKMNCPISDLVKLPPGVNEYMFHFVCFLKFRWIYEKAQFYLEECQLLWESF